MKYNIINKVFLILLLCMWYQ